MLAALYLVGTVLVVRSVIRERGNVGFAALSAAHHAVAAVVAVVLLPPAFAVLLAGLTFRAIALPLVQRRLAGLARPLRPIHVGIVELGASACAVGFAAVARL